MGQGCDREWEADGAPGSWTLFGRPGLSRRSPGNRDIRMLSHPPGTLSAVPPTRTTPDQGPARTSMNRRGSNLLFAATDLSNFLGCAHLTALDRAAVNGEVRKPRYDAPLGIFSSGGPP